MNMYKETSVQGEDIRGSNQIRVVYKVRNMLVFKLLIWNSSFKLCCSNFYGFSPFQDKYNFVSV